MHSFVSYLSIFRPSLSKKSLVWITSKEFVLQKHFLYLKRYCILRVAKIAPLFLHLELFVLLLYMKGENVCKTYCDEPMPWEDWKDLDLNAEQIAICWFLLWELWAVVGVFPKQGDQVFWHSWRHNITHHVTFCGKNLINWNWKEILVTVQKFLKVWHI